MGFGKVKNIIIGTTLAAIVGLSAAASACTIETAHPRAKITFEFNSVEYEVEYTLYRNMYPQTVRHFIELADEKFYDNTVIHDYSSSDWLTGGYSYDEGLYSTAITGDAGAVSEYFQSVSKEEDYYNLFKNNKLTPSVYGNTDFKTDKNGNIVYADENGKTVSADTQGASPVRVIKSDYALPTLMGEFKSNIEQEIENGALTAAAGSLKMFYYEKETAAHVYVTPTSDQIIEATYKNNCATSLFSVQVSESTSYNANEYCVFAKVVDMDDLDALTQAVTEYFEATYGDTKETTAASLLVDNFEEFSKEEKDKGISVTVNAPKTPIIIKTVKITKY